MGWVKVGAVFGAIGVAAGAFGAHGLRDSLEPRMLEVFETAVRYQLIHALALVGVAWVADRRPGRAPQLAGWFFTIGIVVFSGSLYTLVLTDQRWLGAITPIGGVCFIAGWIALATARVSSPQ